MSSGRSLSRQDTLPAEDPSWSYSRVPGQPAPIPPRNEPLLYIPNTLDDSNMHATNSCSKNSQLKIHLPASMASESIFCDIRIDGTTGIRDERLMTSATNIVIQDNYSGKQAMGPQVCITNTPISNFHIDFGVLNQRVHLSQSRLLIWMTRRVAPSCYLRPWFCWS